MMKVPSHLDFPLSLLLVISATPMESQKRGRPGTVMVASWRFPHWNDKQIEPVSRCPADHSLPLPV